MQDKTPSQPLPVVAARNGCLFHSRLPSRDHNCLLTHHVDHISFTLCTYVLANLIAVCGITYKTTLPSCKQARSVKALSDQPILVNSLTYHGFRVSFQVALDSTTKTGQMETTRPAHTTQRFPLVLRT
jgi:hypothetical protein